MRKSNKFGLILAMLLAMLLSFSSALMAAGTYPIPILSSDKDALNTAITVAQKHDSFKLQPKAGSESGTTKELLSLEGTTIQFNVEDFRNATDKSKKDSLSVFVEELGKTDISKQTAQNIFDELGKADKSASAMLIPMIFDSTNADIYTAYKWIFPLLAVVRVIFGVGAIAIVFLLIASTIMDLAYIGLPIAREMGNKDGSKGADSKPFGVSWDALSAVKETESSLDSGGKYKNAYAIYFKRRATTYIILAICLLYLVVGELGGLIGKLMSLGSGIVQ